MSLLQTRQAITGLSQSMFTLFQQLNFSEAKLDEIQSHLDSLLLISNDKTKDVVIDTIGSVDVNRKEKREREKKEKQDKKDKKEEKKEEPVPVEPVKAVRRTKKSVA